MGLLFGNSGEIFRRFHSFKCFIYSVLSGSSIDPVLTDELSKVKECLAFTLYTSQHSSNIGHRHFSQSILYTASGDYCFSEFFGKTFLKNKTFTEFSINLKIFLEMENSKLKWGDYFHIILILFKDHDLIDSRVRIVRMWTLKVALMQIWKSPHMFVFM